MKQDSVCHPLRYLAAFGIFVNEMMTQALSGLYLAAQV
jgi:hypothetical protein